MALCAVSLALISTVYNEGLEIERWVAALQAQTRHPDEFVIVDGGSTDGTPERIAAAFARGKFPAPRVLIERCNIARGRNLAVQNTTADLIASTDAGSFPKPDWLEELTRPLRDDSEVDAVGGRTQIIAENDFQKFLLTMEGQPADDDGLYPSSRNIALRRTAWASVGGYPEWLTLAGEDALYNYELHATGQRFVCNHRAIVRWPLRPTAEAHFSLLYRNAFGAAEAQLYPGYFLRRCVVALFPMLLLLSAHRFSHLRFRYWKNAASALGWIAGKLRGRRPPAGWKKVRGILLSPEAQSHVR